MKERSLVMKLTIIFTLIATITLAAVGVVISVSININNSREEENILEAQSMLIEESLIEYLNQEGANDIEELLYMGSISTNFDIFIVDKLGYIYLTSDLELRELEYTKVELEEISDIRTIENMYKVTKNAKILSYINPVYLDNEVEAYIVMTREYGENDISIVVFSLMCTLAVVLISMIVIVYYTKKIIINPIKNITNAARRLAKGNVEQRVNIVSNDEIGELAESFNVMAEYLEGIDIRRKEFISNVSHELRSPITSIKGFIGGILDGVIPKDREDYYLRIVHDEIERLTRLVNELLEVSLIESGKFDLKEEEFDINLVVETCILNLEHKLKLKKIDIKVIFDSKRTFVIADRDRIIQVLTNILENAIKYGEDNGKIEVSMYSKGDKIYISIFNTGNILSKKDLNNIWERFYRTDKSRNSKTSTGLGLSIVRSILNQHNQDICVRNVEDKGVKFTFSLQKSE